jgi:hypothetical protein
LFFERPNVRGPNVPKIFTLSKITNHRWGAREPRHDPNAFQIQEVQVHNTCQSVLSFMAHEIQRNQIDIY